MSRRIVVVSGGLGQPSSSRLLGDRLADAAARELRTQGEQVEVEVVELRELAVDLAHQLVTGFPGARLGEVLDRVTSADALVAVTPVFNASYSGLFTMFVDALAVGSLDGVPVLLGGDGWERAALARHRARAAAAARLPAGDDHVVRRVRGDRGLGFRPASWTPGSSGPARSWPCSSALLDDPPPSTRTT